MAEGFNDRVGKVFDSLSSSSTTTTWSISDAQIPKNSWNRNKGNKTDVLVPNNKGDDETTLVSSCFDDIWKGKGMKKKKKKTNMFDDFDEDDEDEYEEVDEDLDVSSSIGLDPTLDFEDEEDEYDMIAAGTENNSRHLLYMKDVKNHTKYLNSDTILSKHQCASRTSNNDDDDDDNQPMVDVAPSKLVGDPAQEVKSILKRKSDEMEKSCSKRVRFDPTCKEHDAPQVDGVPVAQVSDKRVPDFLLNPSKYTRYTFNDADDKKSNTAAYMDFLEQIKKSKDVGSEQKPPAAELPTSVVFIPRKKRDDEAPSNTEGQVKESSTGVGIGIADVEVEQDEVSDMLQDEPNVDADCAKPPKFQKPTRQYRSKIEDDDSVC